VSYREIAAFVQRANDSIENPRFRPDIYVRGPRQSDVLMDLSPALARRVEIDGAHAAHYWIDDARGVRLIDFHNGSDQLVRIVRPRGDDPIYVHPEDGSEVLFAISGAPDVVKLTALAPVGQNRGPALLPDPYAAAFMYPFDQHFVQTFGGLRGTTAPAAPDAARTRRSIGLAALALGVLGTGAGVALSVAAAGTAAGATPSESQADLAMRNKRITAFDTSATVAYTAGGLALGAAAVLLLGPLTQHVPIGVSQNGGFIGYRGVF
jgi:hypothetical protein